MKLLTRRSIQIHLFVHLPLIALLFEMQKMALNSSGSQSEECMCTSSRVTERANERSLKSLIRARIHDDVNATPKIEIQVVNQCIFYVCTCRKIKEQKIQRPEPTNKNKSRRVNLFAAILFRQKQTKQIISSKSQIFGKRFVNFRSRFGEVFIHHAMIRA